MSHWSRWIEERLRRVTSRGTFVPEIDALRFVAITSVIAFHLHEQLIHYYGVRLPLMATTLLRNGDRGVKLFFVISGFVLALPFASHKFHGSPPIDLKHYFARRLTRLEPPYVLNLLICAIFLVFIKQVPLSSVFPHFLSSLLYSHNFFYGSISTINVVTWSLEVEVQFYLVMPLLAGIFTIPSDWIRRGLLVCAIVMAVALQTYWIPSQRESLTLVCYIQFFLAGLMLADLYLRRTTDHKKWGWDLVSIVGWPLVFMLEGRFSQIALPFIVIGLYWAAFHGRLTNRLFRLSALTIVGGMCYSFYLFHYLVIAFATRVIGHPGHPLFVVFASIILIFIVSSAYFLLVERPCMDRAWPSKLVAFVWERKKQILTARAANI